MKPFICILALAVASCKAGTNYMYPLEGGLMALASEGISSGGYDYTPGAHGQQDFSSHGQDFHQSGEKSLDGGQSHFGGGIDLSAFQGHNGHSYGLKDFGGHNVAHFQPMTSHDFSGFHGFSGTGKEAPVYESSGHGSAQGQSRGFDVSGFGDVSSYGGSGHDGGDSYLQAAHDFGKHGMSEGHSEKQEDSKGHEKEEHGKGQEHKGFILQDISHDYGHHDDGNTEYAEGYGHLDGHDEAVPVGEHTEVENPVPEPKNKYVQIPVHKPLQINVPKPILIGVPQPYPVKVPIHKPVAVPVNTEITIPIEKVVPYPVVKHVPYPVEKHVPFKVEKTVTVHVPQPYPVKIPIYKTIHHHKDH